MSQASSAEFQTLLVSAEGARGEIVLNRPDRLNAMSVPLLEELAEAAAWMDQRKEVKVAVIRGAGRSFSAGADLEGFAVAGDPDSAARASAARGRRMSDAIATMHAITVASIRGHCLGGAMVLAAACDLRLAAAGTRFGLPEVDLGIPLTWGGVPRLARELGPAICKELILTCRTVEAQELARHGFLNAVVDEAELDDRVRALAEKLASQPRHALSATKRQVDVAPEEPFDEGWLLARSFTDPESLQKGQAYLASRKSGS